MSNLFILPLSLLFPALLFFPEPTETTDNQIQTIAFGSCNSLEKPQPLWNSILENKPDLWIWLGDNIYGDTDNMVTLKEKYRAQKNHPGYQNLLQQVPVIGIWDDHDYGRNDAGKEYPYKKQSKNLLLDFLDVPATAEVYTHEGAYQQYTFGSGKRKVKIILLDGRSFRDPMNILFGIKFPNRKGQFLGEAQWKWLEKQLTNSDAAIHIIASGVQILPRFNQYEKWGNFPKERRRLLNLLAEKKPSGLILLSGDRHLGELTETSLKNYPSPVYELTSSGMTHVRDKSNSPNFKRVGSQVNVLNFGLLKLNWQADQVEVVLEIRGEGNLVHLQQKFLVPLPAA